MRVRFFGQPWGTTRPAPICEDNQFQVPVEKVLDRKCIECHQAMNTRDRGVITACSPGVWGSFRLRLKVTEEDAWDGSEDLIGKEVEYPVCVYHLHCWLQRVIGGEIIGSVAERMRIGRKDLALTAQEVEALQDGAVADEELEDVEPGRGWRS